ncbi:hypothetical protein Q3G72_030531 [Acer saccharum]|nr:hypothetical protein Q3G72_030531 [Acer saccharum]
MAIHKACSREREREAGGGAEIRGLGKAVEVVVDAQRRRRCEPASLGDSSRRWRRSWRCGGQGSRGGGGCAMTTATRSRLRWGTRRGGGGGGAGGCGGGESRG